MVNTTNNHYQTSDTSIACYLITEGFTLLQIDYAQPRYVYTFDGNIDDMRRHEHLYLTGKALTDPSVFTRINRKLMRTIKNLQQWGVNP